MGQDFLDVLTGIFSSLSSIPFDGVGVFEQWETPIKWQYIESKCQIAQTTSLQYIQTWEPDGGRFLQSYQLQWESQTRDDKVADSTFTAFYCKRQYRTLHAIVHIPC